MPFIVATFNVKDLFDAASEGERSLVERKLEGVAATIRACDADVVGLQEIGSLAIARALAQRLGADGYGEPVVGTADGRGIRCVLIARAPLVFGRVDTCCALGFPVFHEGDPSPFAARIPLRRGIVHAGVDAAGLGLVHVIVAHFKSPRPLGLRNVAGAEIAPKTPFERAESTVRATVWRAAEALYTRSLVDAVLLENAAAHVAVIGDLNDVPESAVLRALQSDGEGALFDSTDRIAPSARFSIVHDGRRSQVDHILATAGLAGRLAEARFLNQALRDHGPDGADGTTTDSDHAALVARFD